MALAINKPRFTQAEYKRRLFCAQPEAGVTLEQILAPGYWCHVASQLKTLDRIEVIPADNSFYAELIVLAVLPTGLRVKALGATLLSDPVETAEPAAETEDLADEYEVKYANHTAKWRVRHKPTDTILAENLTTKALAHEWLDDYKAQQQFAN